jgi:hypothetical protein
MRLKARTEFTFAGKDWKTGDIFDAPREQGHDLVNRDQADPYNLEDPSTISFQDRVENLLPDIPPVQISPTSAQVGKAPPGTGSFAVTITGPGASGTWTVEKDAATTWLTVDSPTAPQSTDGQVNYSYFVNLGAERVGKLNVNGQTFTVTQASGL